MKLIISPLFDLKNPLLFVILLSLNLAVINNGCAEDTAQKNEKQSAALEINKTTLQAKIDAINARQGSDEAVKAKLLKLYQSAQDNLATSEAFQAKNAEFKQAIKEAPEQIKKLQRDIEQFQQKMAKQKPEDFSNISTDELDQRLVLEKEKISSLTEQLNTQENELALQQARPQLIRQETVAAQQDLDATQKKLAVSSIDPDAKLTAEANQVYLKTLVDSRSAELKALAVEAISNPARVELLKAQIQLLTLKKNADGPVVTTIEDILAERRQQEAREAQDALSQAENELAGKHPVIQMVTRENIQYSRDLQSIAGKIERYNEQKTKLDAEASEIEGDFKSAEKKISLAGLSPALGKILREQRRNLLDQDQFSLLSETIQNETATTSLEQFKVEDALKKLEDIDAALQETMAQKVDVNMPEEGRMRIQAELRVLLNNQKELLNKLSVVDIAYLRTLGDYDFAMQQMVTQAGKFATFLDERLLWIPSSEPINADYLPGLYHSAQWLISPFNWLSLIKDTLKSMAKRPFLTFIALVSLVVLILGHQIAKHQLQITTSKVEKFYTDHFYHTLKALGLTLILMMPIPLLCFYWGWFLTEHNQVTDFSEAIGTGLLGASIPLFFLQFFYRLFATGGIARKHFQWHQETVDLLRTQIGWIRFVAVPCVFLITSTGASKVTTHSDHLGRLALVISMLAMAYFLRQILNPGSGLLAQHINNDKDGWLSATRFFWYPLVILLPLVIVGFAVAGYYLSALELQQKLIISLRLIFVAIILHEMVFRWLTLINRQLALENVRQKRKAAALTEKHHVAAGGEDPALPIDEKLIDIPKVNAQTIKLLNVFIGFSLIIGFWMIWKNILPAFSFLDNIVLWQHKVLIDNQEIYQSVTMTNLMLSGLYVFTTVVSVLNFSGLIELLVFRRVNIEPGSRYAINQLAKYLLISIGFFLVAHELGGSWAQVQWLVAALGVGLGFGLQEIFANLVSGIILLFERPIRVGDTVTIGDVTGKVSRIQMRATTIIDWDQKELIVPNKTFITNQLVNWTLTDAVTRIVIPVSIAYGSDVEFVHKILLKTVQTTPMVLADPEPCVLLLGFGDNALNFSVRVFVSEMGNRLPVIHNLHTRIEKALREHDLEIPFPQRNVYIRSFIQESKSQTLDKFGGINP